MNDAFDAAKQVSSACGQYNFHYHSDPNGARFYKLLAECVPVTCTSIMYLLFLERQDLKNHFIEAVSMATEVSGSF